MFKAKVLLLSVFTAVFFMNCGENADFFSDDDRFKSLADGETIEIVDDQTLQDAINQGDGGLAGDVGDGTNDGMGDGSDDGDGGAGGGGGTTDGMAGTGGGDGSNDGMNDGSNDGMNDGSNDGMGDDDTYSGPGNSGGRGNGKDDDKKGCKERLVDQDKKKQHDEMMTSPEEIYGDSDMNELISCSANGKKVYVCHFPNGDYNKRKTLCIGRPALYNGHVGSNGNHGHMDYAGKCKNTDGAVADSHDERKESHESEVDNDLLGASGL